ncbi:hypothetical protein GCM10023165_23240 [Variovorax defluvii]|uniref:Uncharacterized protein n=1 Tax=Variovorax defluvii TaxID=913761 RepID=A0ABP8HNR4_9BURK
MALRDLALTVLELEPFEFHWVLMEAVQADSEECLVYRPVDSSTKGLPDYSEALIQGASALRVLQGLAPFGKPMAAIGIGEVEPEPEPASRLADLPPSRESSEPDSCMLTTGHSLL